MLISKCCKEEIMIVEVIGDAWYECLKCGLPCDAISVIQLVMEAINFVPRGTLKDVDYATI